MILWALTVMLGTFQYKFVDTIVLGSKQLHTIGIALFPESLIYPFARFYNYFYLFAIGAMHMLHEWS